jgi:hypothetical protein
MWQLYGPLFSSKKALVSVNWKSQIMDTTQQMPIQVPILGLVKLENDS